MPTLDHRTIEEQSLVEVYVTGRLSDQELECSECIERVEAAESAATDGTSTTSKRVRTGSAGTSGRGRAAQPPSGPR